MISFDCIEKNKYLLSLITIKFVIIMVMSEKIYRIGHRAALFGLIVAILTFVGGAIAIPIVIFARNLPVFKAHNISMTPRTLIGDYYLTGNTYSYSTYEDGTITISSEKGHASLGKIDGASYLYLLKTSEPSTITFNLFVGGQNVYRLDDFKIYRCDSSGTIITKVSPTELRLIGSYMNISLEYDVSDDVYIYAVETSYTERIN